MTKEELREEWLYIQRYCYEFNNDDEYIEWLEDKIIDNINYRELLKRYTQSVASCEGVAFITNGYDNILTKEDEKELENIWREIEI